MSIQVENLTKIYDEQKAVNGINFSIQKGEIVGFLGPNGAGKSTTMKLLTGFIEASEGKATVCDIEVNNDPLAVRKKIGYLPEHNPLYLEMYVKEYLSFVADIYKIDSKKERIAEIIELTGLVREQNKKIKQLSKGYRQRVGLAQAMIHNPEVLILDEPTTGLDPNQILEIRKLIQEIGKEKTVILSSHIMQEVQAICSRIIIINQGEIVADDSIENIQSRFEGESIIKIEFDQKVDESILKHASVNQLIDEGNNNYIVKAKEDIRKDLFDIAVRNNVTIVGMHMEKQSLESIFQSLTK